MRVKYGRLIPQRRLKPFQIGKGLVIQPVDDCPQAIRPFGMARRRQMLAADRMSIETRSHAASVIAKAWLGHDDAICRLSFQQAVFTRGSPIAEERSSIVHRRLA